MTIASTVASGELTDIITNRYVNSYFEARLIDLPAFTYDPSVAGSDTTLLAGEVTLGTGGYSRAIIKYEAGDVGGYSDGGVAMSQKGTIFAHDGGATPIEFSHVALVWSTGNATSVGSVEGKPAGMATTTQAYTNIPTEPGASVGSGLTVDLEVTNGGAALSDYIVTLNKPGYGYEANDVVSISNTTLSALDATTGFGDLTFRVVTIATSANAGELFTSAKTSSTVTLTDGNEAAFYWNLKQYGIN